MRLGIGGLGMPTDVLSSGSTDLYTPRGGRWSNDCIDYLIPFSFETSSSKCLISLSLNSNCCLSNAHSFSNCDLNRSISLTWLDITPSSSITLKLRSWFFSSRWVSDDGFDSSSHIFSSRTKMRALDFTLSSLLRVCLSSCSCHLASSYFCSSTSFSRRFLRASFSFKRRPTSCFTFDSMTTPACRSF